MALLAIEGITKTTPRLVFVVVPKASQAETTARKPRNRVLPVPQPFAYPACMTRVRNIVGGYVYHVLNRSVGRMTLFHEEEDYTAFMRILAKAQQLEPLRLLAHCVMPNHFHLVVWPDVGNDTQVSSFMHWLTTTHACRWHRHRGTTGTGPVYQGRFKAFPVQTERYLYVVLRYVVRNALRAGLVDRAEEWRWSSLRQEVFGPSAILPPIELAEWPVRRPHNWLELVNQPLTPDELTAVRRCVQRGSPFGSDTWVADVAQELGLTYTMRRPGRPHTVISA
jgi:putative transposase